MKLGQIPDSGQDQKDPSKSPLKERGGIPDQEHLVLNKTILKAYNAVHLPVLRYFQV